MAKNLIILILAALFVSTVADKAMAGGSNRTKPLTDGFVLAGVDGKLTRQEGDDRWFFEFDSDVSDDKGRICAGAAIELLPSAALEKTCGVKSRYIGTAASPVRSRSSGATAIPSVRTSNGASYRLWGRVTRYKGKNFIFGIYFLPISEVEQSQSQTSQESQQTKSKLTINEPNDALTIPQEIIAKLARRRIVHPEQLRKGLELKTDYILADRTGFISSLVARRSSLEKENTIYDIRSTIYDIFVFDALGRNAQEVSLRLLPCWALEGAGRQQSAELDPLRFKVAGIVTEYKGEYYLLLQRAIRVYSHGNFGG